MKDAQLDSLVTWITEAGLSRLDESAILTGLCERHWFSAYRSLAPTWSSTLCIRFTRAALSPGNLDKMETMHSEFGRSDEGEDRWERSLFYRLELYREQIFRRRLTAATTAEFPIFADLKT